MNDIYLCMCLRNDTILMIIIIEMISEVLQINKVQ